MRHPALSAVLPCSLSFNNIKGSGEALGEALKVNSSLKELRMQECGLGPEDAKGLAGGIAVHGSLTSLDLSKNALCDIDIYGRGTYDSTGITALAGALRVCASLTEVCALLPASRLPCVL